MIDTITFNNSESPLYIPHRLVGPGGCELRTNPRSFGMDKQAQSRSTHHHGGD